MKKQDLFDRLKVGDRIRNKVYDKIYTVKGFYDHRHGTTIIDSEGHEGQIYSGIINRDYELVPTYDNVNNPQHYASGGIECIDAMIAAYGKEAVMHFCQCNAFKYQWRFDKKNGIEDLKKAQWYNNKYIELKNGN